MKTTYMHSAPPRLLVLGAGLSLFALSASVASAQLIAYEGISNPEIVPGVALPDGSGLTALPATGFGFVGNWTATSKSSSSSSYYSANGGFSYPAGTGGDLPGTESSGGVAVVQGDTGNAFFRLNLGLAEAAAANVDGKLYLSYLTAPLGPESDPAIFGNPFPRNQGIRIPELPAANNNNSLGMIGLNGNDTPGYAAWGFKDTHGLQSGADATLDEVDFVVVELDMAKDHVAFWVNPRADGTSDGYAAFAFTDGGDPKDLAYYAFGAESGSASSGRPAGHVAYDEIRVGSDLYSVSGFETIPEPSVIGLFGFGFIGMLIASRRRR